MDTGPYAVGFLDWLACASAGWSEPAARAAAALGSGLGDRVVRVGTAGHALDFDDDYSPGLAHLSAPTAPAALVVGAALGASIGEVLQAYATGFEAMGAVARASHPALYDRGWHPTAVCGVVGAATAAAALRGLDDERRATAVRLALLAAGGVRAVFGSDGKPLQVGMAAAAGVRGAALAAAGATASPRLLSDAADSFSATYGGQWALPDPARPAVQENWIKAYPCCTQTHPAIEAAASLPGHGIPEGEAVVTMHPVCRQAAWRDDVRTSLEAKFSIPYLVAFTVLHGPPGADGLRTVDAGARALAAHVRVELDPTLGESEVVLRWGYADPVHVEAALGSPARPMSPEQLTAKIHALCGSRLDGALDVPDRPVATLLEAAGLAM